MKATVWTSWNPRAATHDEGKPKCIFVGEIAAIPRSGDWIVVREGFASERVKDVTFDLVDGEVEISVHGIDPDNEYGPCMLYGPNK